MSVILSGPRRIYVVLLMWHRVDSASLVGWRTLAEIDRAISHGVPGRSHERLSRSVFRTVLTVRLQRIFWRRLIGLSLLMFHCSP